MQSTPAISSVLVAVALLGGSTAAAKSPADKLADQREARIALEALADCYFIADGKNAERALEADPKTGAFEKWAGQYRPDTAACRLNVSKKYGVWLEEEGETLRYALAEGAFRRNLAATQLNDLDRVAPLPQGMPPYEPTEFDRAALLLSILSECVVRKDPEGSWQLLSTKAWSDEESSAFNALTPAISGCVDESQKLSIDRQNLRGALALNYLRLARAPREVAPSTTEAKN